MAKINIYTILIFSFISIIFLLVFSVSTSFIYYSYGFDSAIFMVIGKTLASGKQMYIDIFDHKGPILFFIEYIGWKMGKVWGIFILQTLNLTCTLYTIYRICLILKLNLKYIIAILFSFLALLGFTNIEGNQSEEYSLLFLFIPLFLSVKYIFADKSFPHPPIYSLIYGACFCIIAFNRLTNAMAIIGIFLAVILILVLKKEWHNLFQNILFFVIGFIIILVPIIFHFYYYDSLYDMLYATFLYNFKYAKITGSALERMFVVTNLDKFRFFVRISPNILLLATSILLYSNKILNIKGLFISIFIATCTYIAINMGLNSYHYVTLNTVTLVLGLIFLSLVIREKTNNKRFLKIILYIYTIVMVAYFVYQDRIIYTVFKEIPNSTIMSYYVDKGLANSLIKGKERESVFGYNIPPQWYLQVDMVPSSKFFTNHESWIKADSIIYYETNRYLIETPPTWIVIPEHSIVSWTVGVDSNPILKNLIKTHYELKGHDINHKYYRRIR